MPYSSRFSETNSFRLTNNKVMIEKWPIISSVLHYTPIVILFIYLPMLHVIYLVITVLSSRYLLCLNPLSYDALCRAKSQPQQITRKKIRHTSGTIDKLNKVFGTVGGKTICNAHVDRVHSQLFNIAQRISRKRCRKFGRGVRVICFRDYLALYT